MAEINGSIYPVFIRMDGPLLDKKGKIKGKPGKSYDPPGDQIIDRFWETIKKRQEIVWEDINVSK